MKSATRRARRASPNASDRWSARRFAENSTSDGNRPKPPNMAAHLALGRDSPYLASMDEPRPPMPLTPMAAPRRPKRAAFPQPAFRGAAGDLKSMFSNMDRRRWLFLALAFAMTFTVLFGFLLDRAFRKLGPGDPIINVLTGRAHPPATQN